MSSPSEGHRKRLHSGQQQQRQQLQLQQERVAQIYQQNLMNLLAQSSNLRQMPNAGLFNWPMSANSVTNAICSTPSNNQSLNDLSQWNAYVSLLQNTIAQTQQGSFEEIMQKLASANSLASNDVPDAARGLGSMNPMKQRVDAKPKTITKAPSFGSMEPSSSGTSIATEQRSIIMEQGELPNKRIACNGVPKTSVPNLPNMPSNSDLFTSSLIYTMALNHYATTAMQNAMNAEKTKAKSSARKSVPASTSCASRKTDIRFPTSHDKRLPSTSKFIESPLDLSNCKASSSEPADGRSNGSMSTPDSAHDVDVHKKRSVPDITLIRIPLSMGWCRQTCIRSISATGIRGDVIYYAPDGKKLTSYNEVNRHLNKNNITTIGRENFSFSCKIILGEFLIVGGQGSTKTMINVSENDVLAEIERQASGGGSKRSANPTVANVSTEQLLKLQCNRDAKIVNLLQRQLLEAQPFLEKFCTMEKQLHEGLEKVKSEAANCNGMDDVKSTQDISVNCAVRPSKGSISVADEFPPKLKPEEEERVKAVRVPVDDLLLDETRKLPPLDRLPNLTITGSAFADILMVVEFVRNFGHVLQIDPKTVPSLEEITAGIQNDPKHIMSFLRLTRMLLYLALEFPGLPSGIAGRTALGQSLKEVGVHRENFSELMRMFLASRCSRAKEVGKKLETCSFENLDPDSKAGILALFCNELLSCKNVMQEIESNTEEIIRLKGDKWLREGRSRALRGVQAKKRAEQSRRMRHELRGSSECRVGSPNSNISCASEERLPSPPLHCTPTLKALTPGLGQCDIITKEEEEMSIDQLEEYITTMNAEAEELRMKHNSLADRVRILPLGQDRFHRYYWSIPSFGAPLVESVASASLNNPAVNIDVTCANDPPSIRKNRNFYIDPDVIGCVEDILDEICAVKEKPDRSRKVRFRRLDNKCKRGWWTLKSEKQADKLRIALHGRGIRERVLQRVLARDANEFQYSKQLMFNAVDQCLTKCELNKMTCSRLTDKITSLEQKVLNANFCCEPVNTIDANDEDSEDSMDGWSRDEDYLTLKRSIQISESFDLDLDDEFISLKKRLLGVERNIERRYLLHRYHAKSWIPVEKILRAQQPDDGDETVSEDKSDSSSAVQDAKNDDGYKQSDVTTNQLDSSAMVCDESGDTILLQKWRTSVNEAITGAQLMLAIQALDAAVAWEKSIMKVCCQICRNNENESQLLLCDSCDFGYHMYCFRPRITIVPSGDWFCPLCVQRACGKVLCLLCGQYSQTNTIVMCSKCYYGYHPVCFDRPPVINDAKQWTCPGCLNDVETTVTESRESTEKNLDNNRVVSGRPVYSHADTSIACDNGGQKRKVAPSDYDFPQDMLNSLFNAMIDEIWKQLESEPFRYPVDHKAVPLYRKIIKRPVDLSEIRSNIKAHKYETQERFLEDVERIFENCQTFNEDNSPIGVAGSVLHKFYTKRWKQLRYNFSKRLKRMQTKIARPNTE